MHIIKLKDSPKARIMIRAANWVGDAIMTTPVIRAVKKNFPLSTVTVLAKPWVVPVYEHNPYVDEIMIYDNAGRHRMGWGTVRLANDLRSRRFDLAVLMQNAFEAALISFLAGIPERVGYNTDARGLLLKPSIKLDPVLKKGHLIDYYIGILKGVSLQPDGRDLDLFLSERDQAYADSLLDRLGFDPLHPDRSGPVIGINPGATGGTAKRWFPERYAELSRKLGNQYQVRILIFGGPADRALGRDIEKQSKGACINIAGETTLGQAFALINRCSLFVTNDSGLMHAAAALDIHQVAVIGSTDHVATSPSSKNSIMVRVPVSCSPCLKDTCPTDHRCMEKISVDMVFETCKSLLDKTHGPQAGEDSCLTR